MEINENDIQDILTKAGEINNSNYNYVGDDDDDDNDNKNKKNNNNSLSVIDQTLIEGTRVIEGYEVDDEDEKVEQMTMMMDDEKKMRREQSQKASQSISKYLLMGWALIDEVCPNDKCFGVSELDFYQH